MSDAERIDLDGFAKALRCPFPCDDPTLALTLLGLLAEGQPVDAATLALTTGRSEREVGALVEPWPNLELDEHGRVVGFSGLTLRPTPHRFELGDRQLHTWCAWDTLFLPALLEQTAEVRSACPVTGAAIELVVSPRGVDSATPADPRVSFPPLAATDTANIRASFCSQVFFLAGEAAATTWRAGNPGAVALDLDSAHGLGLRTVAPLLGEAAGQANTWS